MRRKKKGKVGSSFVGFLAEQGILEECEEQAVKQILADQIKAAVEKGRLTKAAMAIRFKLEAWRVVRPPLVELSEFQRRELASALDAVGA